MGAIILVVRMYSRGVGTHKVGRYIFKSPNFNNTSFALSVDVVIFEMFRFKICFSWLSSDVSCIN